MKLEARITIAGKSHKLVSDDIALRLSEIGTATFEVQADTEPKGVVTLDNGYTVGVMHRVFSGYVRQATAKSCKHWTLECREIADVLQIPCHLSLRHCLLPDVLRELSGYTELDISTEFGAAYASKKVSRMASTGDGFYAMRTLPRVFGIADFVWWQTPKGGIWCGDWSDSQYAKNGNIEINSKLFTRQSPNSVTLAAMPALRPGMTVNGQRITYVRHAGSKTVLRWKS